MAHRNHHSAAGRLSIYQTVTDRSSHLRSQNWRNFEASGEIRRLSLMVSAKALLLLRVFPSTSGYKVPYRTKYKTDGNYFEQARNNPDGDDGTEQ